MGIHKETEMNASKTMTPHRVVSREAWTKERKALLAKEKAQTRLRDELARARRDLPWVKIEKNYRFETPDGTRSLADLFEGNSQLIVKHFMFGPGWKEGCVGCSFESDHVDGALQHLVQHDVSFVAVSRAPLDEITPFKQRMGWGFPWVSSAQSDFNFDFDVSFPPERVLDGKVMYNYEARDFECEELSGFCVFFKDDAGDIYHTSSAFGRGAEEVLGTYMFLDMTPKGRNENGPRFNLTDWVRHHDRYGTGGGVSSTGRAIAGSQPGGPCCEKHK
jgi:predicted dithiol-disulfide oxidoreductase (DUF899 family)